MRTSTNRTPDWDQVQPEFLDVVGNVGVTFKLAQKDPDGNCTNGITRTVSTLTYEGNQDMKDLIQWPRNRYLNIWVSAGALGVLQAIPCTPPRWPVRGALRRTVSWCWPTTSVPSAPATSAIPTP
jgi:hypothetical protein